MRFRILFISGHLDDARRLQEMLPPVPLDVDHAETLTQARPMLDRETYQAILTASTLADGTWLDVVAAAGRLPVIVTDPQADARLWSQVLNQGGFDLLSQPFYAPEVRRVLAYAATHLYSMAAV